MLYVFSSHCYCQPVIYSLSLFIIYSVNSFIANVICYFTIPSLNKVLYLVSLYLTSIGKRFGLGGGLANKRMKAAQEHSISGGQTIVQSTPQPVAGSNNFNNDGSFLEKFYKIQGLKG